VFVASLVNITALFGEEIYTHVTWLLRAVYQV